MHFYEMKPDDIAVLRLEARLTKEGLARLETVWRKLVGDDGPKLFVLDGGQHLDILSPPKADGPVAAEMDRLNALADEQAKAVAASVDRLIAEVKATSVGSAAKRHERSMNAEILARIADDRRSLRDDIAMAALPEAIRLAFEFVEVNNQIPLTERCAQAAFEFADAFLAERAKVRT